MDISEVVIQTGLSTSTLRYYEERGLITPTSRKGLRRQYAPKTVQTLAFIALAKNAGFQLDEIKTMLGQTGPQVNRSLLLKKAAELDRQIKRLIAIRDGLQHAAVCKEDDHFHCEKFQRFLNLAIKSNK